MRRALLWLYSARAASEPDDSSEPKGRKSRSGLPRSRLRAETYAFGPSWTVALSESGRLRSMDRGRPSALLAVIRISEIGTRPHVRPSQRRNAETQLHRSRCQFRDTVLGAVFVSGDDEAG